jgi:hypothetical protein
LAPVDPFCSDRPRGRLAIAAARYPYSIGYRIAGDEVIVMRFQCAARRRA